MKKLKRVHFGNKRSHALNANRRKWSSNTQKGKIMVDGKLVNIVADARTIRTMKKRANKT